MAFIMDDSIRSVRDAAGGYLETLGEKHPNIVVLNADLTPSTRTKGFIDRFPGRSFNMGIAEQNMVSFAAGLAHEGYMPFVCSMAPFLSMRACEQVRTDVCYGGLPVRFFGTGAGYSAGGAGATHCALEDVAILSSMGGMTVLEPCDPYQAIELLDDCIDWPGPVYIRMGREAGNAAQRPPEKARIGKAIIRRQGGDGAILASGVVVHYALEAAERLQRDMGASIRVVDVHTIKPLDVEAVVSAARTGRVLAAQDHNIIGGLGSMVAMAIAQAGIACRFQALGCPDRFVPLATTEYLYHVNGYDADGLYENMQGMLEG